MTATRPSRPQACSAPSTSVWALGARTAIWPTGHRYNLPSRPWCWKIWSTSSLLAWPAARRTTRPKKMTRPTRTAMPRNNQRGADRTLATFAVTLLAAAAGQLAAAAEPNSSAAANNAPTANSAPAPAAGAAAVVDTDPGQLIDTAAKAMLSELDAHRAEYRKDPAKIGALVDRVLLPHFDTEYSARLVLGKHWNTASPEQRQRFVSA